MVPPKDIFALLDMKVEKKNRNFLYSWLPIGTYHKNMVILKRKLNIKQI
jgi:hypothetical protein